MADEVDKEGLPQTVLDERHVVVLQRMIKESKARAEESGKYSLPYMEEWDVWGLCQSVIDLIKAGKFLAK